MTVFFDRVRKKWKYDFWRNSVRYVGDCCYSGGKRVKSKRDAVEAEKVEQRRVAVAPKLARASALTLAGALAALTPVWERQSHWENRRRYIREITGFFGHGMCMAEFDEGAV